jgi:protoporphyrinogen oxidase
VADPDVPPHKIALNHNSSAFLSQQNRHAIMAEVSISPEKQLDVDQIAPKTIALLGDLGIVDSPEDVIWQDHVDIEYGYPVYTHDRSALVRIIKDWMAQHHIYSLGRFGDWEYINSDKCIEKGLALARELRTHYGAN